MSAINIIQRVARKLLTQNQPKGVITIPNRMTAEAKAGEIAATLQRAGLSMNRFDDFITSETVLIRLLNQIEAFEKKNLADNIRSGIRNTESAKVFDLKGKRIKDTDNIMGGEEMPPPGSRGGPDDIAAPVQSSEETLKNMIMAENKKNIAAMKKRKMLDEAIDNQSPSLSGDRKVDADLVAEDLAERMGLVYDDMPTKERLKLYDEAYQALTKKKFDPPEDMAKGGIARIGLKDGMNRRTFLKLLGGAMAIPIVGKILKPFKIGKKVAQVPIIKTDDVAGKPEWFDQLVNKVIIEGDEVTKRFATKDREIVHMKKIDDDNTVMVYQDLDEGAVRVDYDAPSNMGEDTVSLQYKKPLPDEGDPRPKAEFEATELEPRYVGGPEDADIEFDGLGGGSSIKMLESDVSKLKEYATGQKPTMKEFIDSKKRKDAVKRINEDTMEQAEYIAGKYGDGPEPPDDIDFASGGIARMLGE